MIFLLIGKPRFAEVKAKSPVGFSFFVAPRLPALLLVSGGNSHKGPQLGQPCPWLFSFSCVLKMRMVWFSPPGEFIIPPFIGTIYIMQCSVLQSDPFSARGSCAPQLCSGRGGGCLQHKMVERCRSNRYFQRPHCPGVALFVSLWFKTGLESGALALLGSLPSQVLHWKIYK